MGIVMNDGTVGVEEMTGASRLATGSLESTGIGSVAAIDTVLEVNLEEEDASKEAMNESIKTLSCREF